MNTLSRRTLLGSALLIPVGGITIGAAVAASRQDAAPEGSPEASPMASPEASPVAAGDVVAAGGEIIVDARDIEFSTTAISGPADAEFTITLVNQGVLEHDLYIEALDIQTELLKPGEQGSITVNAPAGEYEYWCTVAGHKQLGMAGMLTLS